MKLSKSTIYETIAGSIAIAIVILLTALPAVTETPTRNVGVSDGLAVIRSSMFRFGMDHGATFEFTEDANLVEQLTARSRQDGTTDVQDGNADDLFFGPYLEAIPANAENGLSTVRVMPADIFEPVLNGSAGWVFVPATGRIYPDLPGDDARGVSYATY